MKKTVWVCYGNRHGGELVCGCACKIKTPLEHSSPTTCPFISGVESDFSRWVKKT